MNQSNPKKRTYLLTQWQNFQLLKVFFFSAIFLINSLTIYGQEITLKGRVIDDDTEEGIPFCSIFIIGDVPIGITSDVDGYFELLLNVNTIQTDTLSVASVGYKRVDKFFERDSSVQIINFRLKSTVLSIEEVEVIAGENPANEIIRQIIKHKSRNERTNFESYEA